MNIKKNLIQITGFILLCLATNTIFSAEKPLGRPFVLKNNSTYDILYKTVEDTTGIGKRLKPGQSALLDQHIPYEFTHIPGYTAITIEQKLKESAAENKAAHMQHVAQEIPVYSISSGIPYGWSTKLNWQLKPR